MKTLVELYKSKSGWRWRMTDCRNKKIIGASTEGYRRRVDAVKNLNRIGAIDYRTWLGSSKAKYEIKMVVET
jgi:uncharacterized protein YegP (UPF0339 family)